MEISSISPPPPPLDDDTFLFDKQYSPEIQASLVRVSEILLSEEQQEEHKNQDHDNGLGYLNGHKDGVEPTEPTFPSAEECLNGQEDQYAYNCYYSTLEAALKPPPPEPQFPDLSVDDNSINGPDQQQQQQLGFQDYYSNVQYLAAVVWPAAAPPVEYEIGAVSNTLPIQPRPANYGRPPLPPKNKAGTTTHWTKKEHVLYLLGHSVCENDWVKISSKYVKTRTPIQIASHNQKHILRQQMKIQFPNTKMRRSIHDITINDIASVDEFVLSSFDDPS